jgi:hypothetical protein
MINFDERRVRFSQMEGNTPTANEQDLKEYIKNCNRLIRDSSKIKSMASELEKSVEKGEKKGQDKSRMILLLSEKNKRLKDKLETEKKKYEDYEALLENNMGLKEEINILGEYKK